jgi:hypothetical protein
VTFASLTLYNFFYTFAYSTSAVALGSIHCYLRLKSSGSIPHRGLLLSSVFNEELLVAPNKQNPLGLLLRPMIEFSFSPLADCYNNICKLEDLLAHNNTDTGELQVHNSGDKQ